MYLVENHLVNDLGNGVHHDRPQSDEDLPRVVEEDDVLGGGDVGDVDVAGHQADGGSREKSGQDETGDLAGDGKKTFTMITGTNNDKRQTQRQMTNTKTIDN